MGTQTLDYREQWSKEAHYSGEVGCHFDTDLLEWAHVAECFWARHDEMFADWAAEVTAVAVARNGAGCTWTAQTHQWTHSSLCPIATPQERWDASPTGRQQMKRRRLETIERVQRAWQNVVEENLIPCDDKYSPLLTDMPGLLDILSGAVAGRAQ